MNDLIYFRKEENMKEFKKCCKNCGFNASGYNKNGLCIAHNSLVGYGGLINDDSLVCPEYEMDINTFCETKGKYGKYL